jgi:hypothetical protein
MSFIERVSEYHSSSRPTFVLFTEFIAFVGTMVVMVGLAILFSFFH